jgi:hypothetical protein
MGVPRKAAVVAVVVIVLGLGAAAVALAGFKPAVSYPTGAETLDVVIADMNGDGKRDLVASNRGDNNVAILRGHGDGTFRAAQHFAAGPSPLGLLQGDWNGDGGRDLAVANQSKAGGVTILLRTGSGFSSHHYPAGAGSSYVLAGRFNGDRRPDLAVSNLDDNTVSILRGKAGGAFAKIGDLATGSFPFGLAVADFNGDGKRDVAVTNDASGSATQVSVFRGRGDGTFRAARNSPAGVGANEMVVARFNGDSIPDLAVTDFSSDEVDILIGTGTGSFKPAKTFPAGLAPADVALGDFNRDGKKDLAITDSRPAGKVAILKRKPGVDFGPPITYPVGSSPYGLAVGRLNIDGRLDAATANYTGTTSVLQGD